jgi:hypothetical protein
VLPVKRRRRDQGGHTIEEPQRGPGVGQLQFIETGWFQRDRTNSMGAFCFEGCSPFDYLIFVSVVFRPSLSPQFLFLIL